jgi:hypothetical protein
LVCLVISACAASALAADAVVRVNEINANIISGCDLVELRVMSGGSMDAFQLFESTTSILTFTGLEVAENDYVVVHINSAACSPGCSNETTGPGQSICPASFAQAFDWYSPDTSIASTTNVLTLYGSVGNIVDAVLLADDASGTAAAAETQAAALASASQWTMVGGGVPPGGFVDGDFRAHAVLDLNATSTNAAGTSIQRTNDEDSNTKADWAMVATASWGFNNAGQTDFPEPPPVPIAGRNTRFALMLMLLGPSLAATAERVRRIRTPAE